jgi:hypothetical protein
MTDTDQSHCLSWTDDDNWTYQKTDLQFRYLLDQSAHRPLTQIERDWISTFVPKSFLDEV